MGFFRIRTIVDERPGRLASLTAALAARGGNILGLSVQTDADGTVDEFVADVPAHPETVREALEAAGGRRVQVVPAGAHELTDEPTRALLLAARLRSAPWRLPELLAELLRADDARWIYGEAVRDLPDPTQLIVPVTTAKRPGDTATERRPGDTATERGPAATATESGAGTVAGSRDAVVVARSVRLRRAELPFTLTEAARAAAFARLAQPQAASEEARPGRGAGAAREIKLGDGAEVTVRPLTEIYREAVRDLHDRCSPEARRFRYFTSMPTLPARMFDRLCDRSRGHSIVAGHDGQVVAMADLVFTPDPGTAEMAFLVEDRWQGRGLGRELAEILLATARDLGCAEVRATMLSDNVRMRRLLIGLGAVLGYTDDPGVVEARLPIATLAPA
ncbi:GNAT family N-acetyltransferase [Nonomuraea sp. NN258]|uniref:GNAT family N-acetyltransferase n=1 Tax=Nonomuraea antri TaxID=2730852 RepID=UPI00156879CC|nr:GNAT family N-acetyltransferase [Nonomuraea antri]NRQ36073.1 GNAT family N-acetyltransferase [Nonomuraea antri]